MALNKMIAKCSCIVAVMLFQFSQASASLMEWFNGKDAVTVSIQKATDPVVSVAFEMFSGDMEAVTGKAAAIETAEKAVIRLYEIDKASKSELKKMASLGIDTDSLSALTDGYQIKVTGNQIVISGSNGRGAAYGLLELSRMAGVSPWVWWGDLVPEKKDVLTIDDSFDLIKGASVAYRGIFINDEDWSLRPWSYGNYEKSEFGTVGPNTYKKVCQLLLRLRANALWPAMHTGSVAFFKIKGAKAVADSCGIVIGTSHCEPLLRNNVDEWDVKERGRYNYITNRQAVQDYWAERLKEVSGSAGGNMFTIGMRGIHDGSMEGVSTMSEKLDALQQVIDDQQDLLRQYIGEPSEQVQVFVPYKEVLQIYEKGLKVPDYVTLMWCDDNYGYMTRLSNEEEQERIGGGGIYYHLSYWGRPHDYLWLTTTQPGLIYNELKEAYDHNVKKIWIVNVHDPKVAGYDLELFLDMAWDIEAVSPSTISDHYKAWLSRQFGEEAAGKLFPAMYEWYRLCGERRPEFMGWSQVELDKKTYSRGLSPVKNSEFSQTEFGGELDRYLESFAKVAEIVKEAETLVRPELKDAYFAAIEYPVLASEAHARKILESQKARSIANGLTTKGMYDNQDELYDATARSQQAYQEIRKLTEYYNETMSDGKWNRSMSMRPRDLPVFAAPSLPTSLTEEEIDERINKKHHDVSAHSLSSLDGVIAMNACDYQDASEGVEKVQMLGHSMNAVRLPKGGELKYTFTTDKSGKALVKTALIPTQPNDDGDLRFSVSVDGSEPTVFSLKEEFRSEGWKVNVLRGQAVKSFEIENLEAGDHTLSIKALDNHIVVDQWLADYDTKRSYYLFPIGTEFAY